MVSFSHDDSASITGGAFWDGDAVGSPARWIYVFADFAYGSLRYLTFDGARLGREPVELEKLPSAFALHVGPDGALYYLSASTGELRRLERRQ